MEPKLTGAEVINNWLKRPLIKDNTIQSWPFQMMEFAACEMLTQNARIAGWFGKSRAPFLEGEMDREHNYLVSCGLNRQALLRIKDEQWELSKKTMRYTTPVYLKTLLDANDVLMKAAKINSSEGCPFERIKSHLNDVEAQNSEIQEWLWSSRALDWDIGPKDFRNCHRIILCAVKVIWEELLLLEKFALKYKLSDDFH